MHTDETAPIAQKQSCSPLPDAPTVAGLRTSECLALCAMRAWGWAASGKDHALALFKGGLEKAGCGDSAGSFASLLFVMRECATRPAVINSATDPRLSDDEKRLFHAFSAQQRGYALDAFDVLTPMMTATAARLAMAHADRIGLSFGRAGLYFPERNWRLQELSCVHRLRAPHSAHTAVRYMVH